MEQNAAIIYNKLKREGNTKQKNLLIIKKKPAKYLSSNKFNLVSTVPFHIFAA